MPIKVTDEEVLKQLNALTGEAPGVIRNASKSGKLQLAVNGSLVDYRKQGNSARQRAIDDAASDSVDIPQASTAIERQPERQSISTSEANAKLDRMIAEQQRRKAQESSPVARQKVNIPVRQITVRTADGDELRYVDKAGKMYLNDPND